MRPSLRAVVEADTLYRFHQRRASVARRDRDAILASVAERARREASRRLGKALSTKTSGRRS